MTAQGRGGNELAERLAGLALLVRARGRAGSPLEHDAATAAVLAEIERCRELAAIIAGAGASPDANDPLPGDAHLDRAQAANDEGDPRIARALRALRGQLGAGWTVAALARVAGMSRAAFARLFVATLGVPPLRHLATMRMREAARMLTETDDGLAAIAGQLGYASEFAFSRAFKRHTGVAPAIHRRLARDARRTAAPLVRDGRTRLRAVA